MGPSRKTLRPSWCPKLVTGLVLAFAVLRCVIATHSAQFHTTHNSKVTLIMHVWRIWLTRFVAFVFPAKSHFESSFGVIVLHGGAYVRKKAVPSRNCRRTSTVSGNN